jgi:hypothetical protein
MSDEVVTSGQSQPSIWLLLTMHGKLAMSSAGSVALPCGRRAMRWVDFINLSCEVIVAFATSMVGSFF